MSAVAERLESAYQLAVTTATRRAITHVERAQTTRLQ